MTEVFINTVLLSLEPPSYMVVSNRKLVNILFFFSFNTFTTSITNNIDMEVDIPRGRLVNSSANVSRDLLVHFNIFSISYIEKIEV